MYLLRDTVCTAMLQCGYNIPITYIICVPVCPRNYRFMCCSDLIKLRACCCMCVLVKQLGLSRQLDRAKTK